MSKIGYLVAAILGLAAMGAAWSSWRAMGDVPMGMNGILAMILGAIATLALGGGLVALLFISQRKGFDEGVGGAPRPDRPPDRRD